MVKLYVSLHLKSQNNLHVSFHMLTSRNTRFTHQYFHHRNRRSVERHLRNKNEQNNLQPYPTTAKYYSENTIDPSDLLSQELVSI